MDPDAIDPWSPDFGVTDPTLLSPEELGEKAQALSEDLRKLEVPTHEGRHAPMKNWVTCPGRGVSTPSQRVTGLRPSARGSAQSSSRARTNSRASPFPRSSSMSSTGPAIWPASIWPRNSAASAEAMGRLAELLETELVRAQRRAGAYRFEDITFLLGGPDPAGARNDLQYRLDQQVRHLLLDEFQDTSLEQWRALSPVADELLSGYLDERAGVIVADTKQSIYGWRGRTARVGPSGGRCLRPRRHHAGVGRGARAGRSSSLWPTSFGTSATNPVLESIDVGVPVASGWMEDFTELEAARPLPGHVCIHLAPDDNSRGRHPAAPPPPCGGGRQGVARANAAPNHRRTRPPERSPGSSHERAERPRDPRQRRRRGTSLTDTPPVNALLSLLRMADHPSDRAARYHVARTPLGEVVGFTDWRDSSTRRGPSRTGFGAGLLERWVRPDPGQLGS